jgi:hypothetical protein
MSFWLHSNNGGLLGDSGGADLLDGTNVGRSAVQANAVCCCCTPTAWTPRPHILDRRASRPGAAG